MEKIIFVQLLAITLTSLLATSSSHVVKVINSTGIGEVKLPPAPEDKSGSVVYVYPEENGKKASKQSAEVPKSGDKKIDTICYIRVEENGDLIVYNNTRQEVEKQGKVVFDEICVGDGDRILGSATIASLGG